MSLELPQGCRWHAFISHSQSTGGDQAQVLALELKLAGWEVWYDQNADILTLDGMREGVEKSAVFILLLTEGVLTRPFVHFEMATAIKADVPWFLIHEEDARHGKFSFDEFGNAPAFTKTALGLGNAEDGDDGPILEPADIKSIASSVESLAWRRRGYEKRSLINELVNRFANRALFIPNLNSGGLAHTSVVSEIPAAKAALDADADGEFPTSNPICHTPEQSFL